MREPVSTKQLNHSLNYARVGLVGHRLLLVMILVVHKRKSNLARQNKSPRFVVALRSGSLPLAFATAHNKALPNCFGANLQKEVYTNRLCLRMANCWPKQGLQETYLSECEKDTNGNDECWD